MSISLTTHVLDTMRGAPASGVAIELHAGHRLIASAETDADGRATVAEELEPNDYQLVFHPPSPFFTRVELEIRLESGHYHVPLLISPYGLSSYRGS